VGLYFGPVWVATKHYTENVSLLSSDGRILEYKNDPSGKDYFGQFGPTKTWGLNVTYVTSPAPLIVAWNESAVGYQRPKIDRRCYYVWLFGPRIKLWESEYIPGPGALPDDPVLRLAKLKQILDEGLIEQAQYDATKKRILSALPAEKGP